MSDQELVRNVPAALHAMVAACADDVAAGGEIQPAVGGSRAEAGDLPAVVGGGSQNQNGVQRAAGLDEGVVPDEDALETTADATAEMMMLRTQQQYALEDLMAGKSYADAARTAGVTRRTLSRWVNEDPAFRAAMEAWRRRTVRAIEDRLMQGAEVAAATLSGAAARDFRAAALLLKGRGLLPGAVRQMKPVEHNPLVLAVPPGKRRDFEVRLRELILSFKDEDLGRREADERGMESEGLFTAETQSPQRG
ncbi:MAG TPA: hypothetical protein VFE47_09240 [Tepidisphaeraceae bacterium]|jgi:hypothetical protein|nr:hypothetical protein [Tepidisphaeraceae bacterium]